MEQLSSTAVHTIFEKNTQLWLRLLQLISPQTCESEPGQIILKVLAKLGKRPIHRPPQCISLHGCMLSKVSNEPDMSL